MQVTLKQNEITAAIAAYLTNVLGVKNVSPETLSVVYKQGRSDKNGMTAELDIEAPAYHKVANDAPKTVQASVAQDNTGDTAGNGLLSGFGSIQPEAISASDAQAPVDAQVVDATEPAQDAPEQVLDSASPIVEPSYDGERRAEPREEAPVEVASVEVEDEVAQALAEDAKAEEAEATVVPEEEAPVAATAAPLFG